MLITAGIVVLADAGLTLVWQEPLSAAYGSLEQGKAEDQLDDLEAQYPSPADLAAIAGVSGTAAKARILADRFEPHLQEGHAIGRIKIDRIGLDMVVVQGTDTVLAAEGPRPLQEHPAAGPARHGRDRRPPHHLPGALPPHRPDRERRRDPDRDALRRLHLHRPETRDRRPERRRDPQAGRLRRAGHDGLPPALQRLPPLRGLLEAFTDRPLRDQRRGPLAHAVAAAVDATAAGDRQPVPAE